MWVKISVGRIPEIPIIDLPTEADSSSVFLHCRSLLLSPSVSPHFRRPLKNFPCYAGRRGDPLDFKAAERTLLSFCVSLTDNNTTQTTAALLVEQYYVQVLRGVGGLLDSSREDE